MFNQGQYLFMSLPRRIPVPFTNIPAEEDRVAKEIQLTCQDEQLRFEATGLLATTIPHDDVTPQSGWKHAVFQPRRPPRSTYQPVTRATTKHYCYPQLRELFHRLGVDGVDPTSYDALDVFRAVASERDRTVVWRLETDVEVAVRKRIEAMDKDHRIRQERAVELRKELLAGKATGDYERQYRANKLDCVFESSRDLKKIQEIDRRMSDDAVLSKVEEEKQRVLGELRKAQRQQDAIARKAERDKKLRKILQEEEEARENLDAVMRLRSRFDEEKARLQ